MQQLANARRLTDYRCPRCHASQWRVSDEAWRCGACDSVYTCVRGVPRLYIEAAVGAQDREVRDSFYGGIVGSYYKFAMPLLSMPLRPFNLSWPHWATFAAAWALTIALVAHVVNLVVVRGVGSFAALDAVIVLLLLGLVAFFVKHSYFGYLMLLALPVRISLGRSAFKPHQTFRDVHREVIDTLKLRPGRLKVLDIATGNCASLYRHGWMELDAEYTGVDLSETMLMQGVDFMAAAGVPVEFALADGANLPFESETFDVVLNYGAINSMSDPALALAEMARVTKPGGTMLLMDEQMYAAASVVERAYFRHVLASHDTIDHCPLELMPPGLSEVTENQVYHFYYVCVATKAG